VGAQGKSSCTIVDCGYSREMDLAIEIPGSPLEAVMSNEVWTEVYTRLADLIEAHRTTLVFVNTRRLAERVTHHLCQRLGPDKVTSHHGSLASRLRLEAEDRLKRGELKALVATASLELGIDIGSVDLVCQLGSTRSIGTLLQRVGRARHQRGGLPKGRIFPLSRDELLECAALLRSLRAGELDSLRVPAKPLDVLAQQIVACAANEDWDEQKLFDLVRSAWPYRHLTRDEFEEVLRMLAEGFSTKRGRRGALLHHDAVNHRVRARRGARLIALTSGGAIPDNADYRVVLEPSETFIGTVNEDFAFESAAGDTFQLGSTTWRILRINSGTIRVEDAQGQLPNIPFWLGEAPGRTAELSRAVSELRGDIEKMIAPADLHDLPSSAAAAPRPGKPGRTREPDPPFALPLPTPSPAGKSPTEDHHAHDEDTMLQARNQPAPLLGPAPITTWLIAETSIPEPAARQLVDYLAATHQSLGLIPSQQKLVLERFFDESGGMQLVIHSPYGIRLNRAWGLALRKRFCRSFNFELQAAATDDAIVLSLGTQHSFPLEEVFHYLNSKTVRDLLVQALLDSPMFPTRWRWNATRALALPRQRGGRKIPAPLQRMEAESLLAAVFPDQLACLENITGDREIPDHPLVRQTIDDCLTEAMDIEGLIVLLKRIETGAVLCIARDLPEPSPLAHEILNAKPYAFLDNAPLEERRTKAIHTRRASDSSTESAEGILDAAAIERVCAEAWPSATNPDEVHEALLLAGALDEDELRRVASDSPAWLQTLASTKRAGRLNHRLWIAAERLPLLQAVYPEAAIDPLLKAPENEAKRHWERADALRELVRGRLEISGPVTVSTLAGILQLPPSQIEGALLALEAEGFVLRGKFHPGAPELEWCDRRLLARIHRLTLNRLRAEIQPVSIAEYLRFLQVWQRADPEHNAEGPAGVQAVLELLDGFELPAAAWEPEVLALRVKDYSPQWLDQLCFTGHIGWGRLTAPQVQKSRPFAPLRSSPMALFSRENLPHWLDLSASAGAREFTPDTRQVLETMSQRGALFFNELAKLKGLLPSRIEQALAELAAQGWVTSDSFEGLRALLLPPEKRIPFSDPTRKRRHKSVSSVEFAGRWSLLRNPSDALATGNGHDPGHRDAAIEAFARALLRRYGVIFRRLLERESLPVSWYELGRVYRRLEARGEIRGGYFIGGISGEQFALPEAIGLLRSVRKQAPEGQLLTISGADPLNLGGILTPGPRVAAIAPHRILLRDGVPIAALEAGQLIQFSPPSAELDPAIEPALRLGTMPAALRPYYG
jgi:ATP-dependent Lhr-like helicase